jgi:hypothetical protein
MLGVGDVADWWSVGENEDWRQEDGCTVKKMNSSRKIKLKY